MNKLPGTSGSSNTYNGNARRIRVVLAMADRTIGAASLSTIGEATEAYYRKKGILFPYLRLLYNFPPLRYLKGGKRT